jgi:hypothetical protein
MSSQAGFVTKNGNLSAKALKRFLSRRNCQREEKLQKLSLPRLRRRK